ncbi:MAG: SDR family NAD(P)-dependent oxidoreductase [Oscillospiraceae bacterium]|nr:SDR family NAD(P)-dependent oxidoreductase [Oscillospiraceae bacterium]
MKNKKWILKHTKSLKNKTVLISGATGGIGRETCKILASIEANLILLDRNSERSNALKKELKGLYPKIAIKNIIADCEDISSVKRAVSELSLEKIDYIILNAGAYSIPRRRTSCGYDNVFTINFIAPYFLAKSLLENKKLQDTKVIAVGSIAHNYSKTDESDIDFSSRKASSLVYGNSKRYLMFSLAKLFEGTDNFSLVHPGITFTNITAHYPKLIFAIIKNPMKIIFMKPYTAALNTVYGIFNATPKGFWIGPRIFNIWGKPSFKKLGTYTDAEAERIFNIAEKIYNEIK